MPVTIKTSVLTGNGYAVKADVKEASETAEVLGTTLTIWGTPDAEAHDNSRGWFCLAGGIKGHTCEQLKEKNAKPYLTMPTYCSAAARVLGGSAVVGTHRKQGNAQTGTGSAEAAGAL